MCQNTHLDRDWWGRLRTFSYADSSVPAGRRAHRRVATDDASHETVIPLEPRTERSMGDRPSEVEEDRLVRTLQADVEAVAVAVALGQERLPPIGGDAVGHRRLLEADARGEVAQQSPREHVRRQTGHPRDDGLPAPVVVGGAAREGGRLARPDLDHRIGDRLTGSVIHDAADV